MDISVEIYLVVVIVLIVISGLFSCFETAVTAASRAKIHRLKRDGDKKAAILEELLQNREKVISTILLGNNTVNILASVIATSVFIRLFGNSGLVYATILMTSLVIVFAEVLPKTYAIKSPDSIALLFAPLVNFLVKIFFPITDTIQKIVNFLLVNPSVNSQPSEREEIRDTVSLKHIEGSIYKYDKDMLDGVLDLADTEISEIMVYRKEIESINIELSTKEIIKKALETSYTRIPLWRGNKENVVAVLNVRKLLKALHFYNDSYLKGSARSFDKFDLRSITTPVWFVPDSNSLREQLFLFRKKKKRFAMVIDEYGSLQGLVTLEDILEEIVGEIKEKDGSEINIIKTKSGACKITGKTLIRDINKKLNWDISEDNDACNLTAFVINSLDRVPEEKESFLADGYHFEVMKKKNQDLVLLKVRKVKK